MSLAALGMYDMQELRSSTDRYWGFLRDSLRDYGFQADDNLTRGGEFTASWYDPNLLFSHTCGLPYTRFLRDTVSLVGTPAFDIDCGTGYYFSVLCVHQDSDFQGIDDFADKTYAYNGEESQSGFSALHHTFLPFYDKGLNFSKGVKTGGHLNSIFAVAEGKADIAAIDAVTWKIVNRYYESTTQKLRIFAYSQAVPGMPYITAKRPESEVMKITQAVSDAMVATDNETLEQLFIVGFSQISDEDYTILQSNWNSLPHGNLILEKKNDGE